MATEETETAKQELTSQEKVLAVYPEFHSGTVPFNGWRVWASTDTTQPHIGMGSTEEEALEDAAASLPTPQTQATPSQLAAPGSERERFEAWCEADLLPLEHSNWFKRDEDGEYELQYIEDRWQGWQASLASRAPYSPELLEDVGVSSVEELADRASIGVALLEKLATLLPDWHPADCPSEVVSYLLNRRAGDHCPICGHLWGCHWHNKTNGERGCIGPNAALVPNPHEKKCRCKESPYSPDASAEVVELREAMIAVIRKELTDEQKSGPYGDEGAWGTRHPDVLLEGVKAVGYKDQPERHANTFAGFVADAIIRLLSPREQQSEATEEKVTWRVELKSEDDNRFFDFGGETFARDAYTLAVLSGRHDVYKLVRISTRETVVETRSSKPETVEKEGSL